MMTVNKRESTCVQDLIKERLFHKNPSPVMPSTLSDIQATCEMELAYESQEITAREQARGLSELEAK